MVEYECMRCGYKTSQRCNFKNHLNRKNICKPLGEDISIQYIQQYYNLDVTKNTTVYEQVKPGFKQVKPSLDNNFRTGKNQEKPAFSNFRTGKNQAKPAFKSNEIKCKYCSKWFT